MTSTTNSKNDIINIIVYDIAVLTAKKLFSKQNELSIIKWTDGESNLDSEYSTLACACSIEAWNDISCKYKLSNLLNVEFNSPDINVNFIFNTNTIKKKIELKSSKKTSFPGSTIKNLDINQPLIYCLRPKKDNEKYKIRCSQYHCAMGDSDVELFQDRTPRPTINFLKMNDVDDVHSFKYVDKISWIDHYSTCALNRLTCQKELVYSWQDTLIKKIKDQIIDDFIKDTSIDAFIKLKENYTAKNNH